MTHTQPAPPPAAVATEAPPLILAGIATRVVDIFRDSELKGWAKALWILALLVVPDLSALICSIARGGGMNKRQYAAVEQSREATEEYIRSVAGNDPAKQIADAKALLDSGAITADEFAQLKAKALA